MASKCILRTVCSLSRAKPRGIKRCFSTTDKARMRFVQYTCNGGDLQRLGAQVSPDGDIIEISSIEPCIPNNLVDFLKGGPELISLTKSVIAEGKATIGVDKVRLLAPITKPDKILCVGLNYKSHCDEQNKPHPKEPFFFNKFPSTIVSPTGTVKHPPNTKALDWEVELAVVMGRKCRSVMPTEADAYIFGYTAAQDISARDWQKTKNNGQWLFAKSMDDFCPLGPSVVMKEFLPDPHSLQLTCSVNGVKKQDGNTNDMVHNVHDIVAFLSHCITLLPGDIILTGTPSGVGVFRNPREFLKVGDVVETSISGIGSLRNKIV